MAFNCRLQKDAKKLLKRCFFDSLRNFDRFTLLKNCIKVAFTILFKRELRNSCQNIA